MKATIEIADDLFQRVRNLARKEKTTLRALTEQGLRLVLRQREGQRVKWEWRPVVVRGEGMKAEFRDGGGERIRDEIYRGRRA